MKQPKKIPNTLNCLLTTLLILENSFILFALPWLTHNTLLITLVLSLDIIAIRLTNLHWHITHEAVHGMLTNSRRLNEWLGTWLAALLLSSFSIARYGHLNHHRNNRYADTQEVYYQKDKPNRLYYYFEILGGFFILYEFLLIPLAWGPKAVIQNIIQKKIDDRAGQHDQAMYIDLKKIIDNPRAIKIVKKEFLLLLIMLTVSLYSYSTHLILWLIYFFIRAFFISYLNNMPHYKNSVQTDRNASNTAYLPTLLARCYLNFNYHKTHHESPNIPWIYLPKHFKENNGEFDCNYFKEYLQQLKGPIYYKTLYSKD